MTRRPGRLLKTRESTAHDNRVGLKHTPWNFTANISEPIEGIRLLSISSRAVNTRFVVEVDDKIIQKRVTHIIVVYWMINPNHEQTLSDLSSNFQ